jgi:hypothetical protein
MTKKQERIESQNRASLILMLRGQLNRQVPELKVDKRYLDQLKGFSVDDLENDVKVSLSSLSYDSMVALLGDIPRIMNTEWIPIDYAALGL